MVIEVVHTQWAGEDDVFQGGVHELSGTECACGVTHGKPSAQLLRLIAGAEAAGSLNVVDANEQHRSKLDKAVQSQDDAEKAYAAAQPVYDAASGEIVRDGAWRHGNLTNFAIDRAEQIRQLDAAGKGTAGARDRRALLTAELDQAQAALAEIAEPS